MINMDRNNSLIRGEDMYGALSSQGGCNEKNSISISINSYQQ